MLFPTPTFAIFLTAVLLASWLLGSRPRAWRLLLVGSSALFYGWASSRMLLLLGLAVLGNWALGRLVAKHRYALPLGIVANLGVLATYKYYDFFATSVADALRDAGIELHPPLLQLVLPVGLSFITFAAIAYLVEVRRGVTPPAPLLDVAVWLSFFPTVTAGPITRPSELMPQLPKAGDRRRIAVGEATWLLARGLVKKVVLASWLSSTITESVFATPSVHTGPELLLGVYAYAAQIYLDFSGYTDLARGSALLLGIRLPENFDLPYAATSIHDFWNRWHLTLSRWLRDFLFTPLARRWRAHWWRSFGVPVVVMALAGLWHGAAWTFVAFGLVHGVALAVERGMREHRRAHGRHHNETVVARVLHRVVAFHVVCLGWVFFASESLGQATVLLRGLVHGWSVAPAVPALLFLVLAAVLVVQLLPRRLTDDARALYVRAPTVLQPVALAGALVVVDALGPQGVAPFIYYRF